MSLLTGLTKVNQRENPECSVFVISFIEFSVLSSFLGSEFIGCEDLRLLLLFYLLTCMFIHA